MSSAIAEFWGRIEPSRRRPLVILLVALGLTLGGSYLLFRSRGAMTVLFADLPPSESRDIATELVRQGIECKVSEDESTVSVPSRLEARARMRLAAAGLPRTAPPKGWEIFGDGGLAVTKPQQQALQIRALQGELARSIASLESVSKAAVHISLKGDSPFVEDVEPAKAAVLLTLKPGATIDRQQAMAIAFLVAKSVPDLETAQVTILDERGNLLFSDNVAHGSGESDGSRDVEREIERRVQSQLDMAFGLGKAIVRATAEIETERAEIHRTTYRPLDGQREGVPGREVVENESYEGGRGRPIGGVPGTSANLFADNALARSTDGRSGQYTRQHSERDFKVNEETELRVKPGGSLKRLSLGIFVDESVAGDINRIETVARSAAGIDPQRGDTISVEAVKFQASPTNGFEGGGRLEMIRTVARLVLNSLALIIGLLTIRSIVTALRPGGAPVAPGLTTTPLLTDGTLTAPALAGVAAPGYAAAAGGYELPDNGPGLTLPRAGAGGDGQTPLLSAPESSDDSTVDLLGGQVGRTPEEMVATLESSSSQDIAEVLRHWLEGDLNA